MIGEIETKTARTVEMLEREGLGGVLLNGQHNFAWITGGASNAIDKSRDNGAASILIRRDGGRFLLANNIEMPRVLAEEISADYSKGVLTINVTMPEELEPTEPRKIPVSIQTS